MPRHSMQLVMAIASADGNGTLSLEEILEAQRHSFAHADTNGNSQLTTEEVETFIEGKPSEQ